MRGSRAWKIIAYAPIFAVFYTNALFIRNHFYVGGAYFHDSGWFSDTVFQAGIIPRNPAMSEFIKYYWGWHVTIVVAVGSWLSYLFPGDRVDWYAVFQGLIYAPLALAVPLSVPAAERSGVRPAVLVAACSLAFAFNGQVMSSMGYPHFEIFASAGIAIMLAGLATGREPVAWLGLAIAIATREDCGFHAASFLVAVLAADFLGRPFPIARRRVLIMTGVGLASTVVMIVIQKKLFVSLNAFQIYITGAPPYAHLTSSAIHERIAIFGTKCGVFWVAMAAAVVVAIARRDARYLLGWLATVPWLLLNLTAAQDVKAHLSVYTGFPCVGSTFWIFAYGRVEDTKRSWRWPLLAGGFASLAATAGMFWSFPVAGIALLQSATISSVKNPAGLRAFARGLRAREYGNIRRDEAIASWSIETVKEADFVTAAELESGITLGDGYAFFFVGTTPKILARSPFPKCGHVADTPAFFCTREDRPLPPTVVPASPMLRIIQLANEDVRREGEVVVVDSSPLPRVATFGPYERLEGGSYRVTWDLVFAECVGAAPPVVVDVLRSGTEILGMENVDPASPTPAIEFTIASGQKAEPIEFRTWSGRCGFTLRGIDLRRVGP